MARPAGAALERSDRLRLPDVIDVLVCTHGRRDMCCGARGMELVNALSEQPIAAPGMNVRLLRTGHTGRASLRPDGRCAAVRHPLGMG